MSNLSSSSSVISSCLANDAQLGIPYIPLEEVLQSYHEFVWTSKSEGVTSVSLVGSWDNWTEHLALEKIEGSYRVLKALEPGPYEFKFIVNSEWQIDPLQPHRENASGHLNNVLKVPSSSSGGDIHVLDPIPLDPSVLTSSGAGMLSYNRIGHVPPDFLPSNVPLQLNTPIQHLQNAKLSSMQLFPLAFNAHTSHQHIKQTNNTMYGSVRWDFPPAELSRNHCLLFYIDLPSIQFIDSIDLDVGLLRPWLGWVHASLAHEYSLSISYHSNAGWLDYIRRYSITHLLAYTPTQNADTEHSGAQNTEQSKDQRSNLFPLSSDAKVRRCSLSVNIRAQKLCVALHADPIHPKATLSRSNSSTSLNGGDTSPSTPRLSLSLPTPPTANPLFSIPKNGTSSDTTGSSSWKKQFTFSDHFDRNGLLYWLGTNEGREKLWQNPALTGKVGLEISHPKLTTGDMKKSNIVARHSVEPTFWGGSAPLWFVVDLGQFYRFSPNYYTLRHGHSSPNSYICDWAFQASHDGVDWLTLHSQLDSPFTHGFDARSFVVPQFPEYYRYFRILQKGNYSMKSANASVSSNDAGGAPFLCISGFEMYGELVTALAKPAANLVTSLAVSLRSLSLVQNHVPTILFKHAQDFDTRGILYHIATNGGTEPYVNPSESGRVDLMLSHADLHSASMSKHNVIAHANSSATFWGGSAPQWFVVDLRTNWVKVNAYSLRHGYSAANSYLRDWEFAGSADGTTWVTLHEGHDATFSKGFDTETWHIKDCSELYRYFRVLQKGNYSMGSANSAGAPYMCIAGFELYGELTGMRVTHDTKVDYVASQMRRAQRQAFYANRDFHLQLLQLVVSPSTTTEIRDQALESLIDVCSHSMIPLTYHKLHMDLPNFFKHCLLNPSMSISAKAFHLLGNILLIPRRYEIEKVLHSPNSRQQRNFAKDTLDLVLELIRERISVFESSHTLNLTMELLMTVWDQDPEQAHATCTSALLEISELIKHHRSPYYNLLRSQYGIYTFSMEKRLFAPRAKHLEAEALGKFHVGDVLNNLGESIDELQYALVMVQIEFSNRCSALRGLLDEIYALQEPFGCYEKDVHSANEECLRYQTIVEIILERIRKISPTHSSVTTFLEDSHLDRFEYTAGRLLYVLNIQCGTDTPHAPNVEPASFKRKRALVASQFQHSIDYLLSIFGSLCLYTSPSICNQAVKFLIPELGAHLSFPSTILTRYFSATSDFDDPINMFRVESVFEAMVEIIVSNKKMRVSFSDALFDLLDTISHSSLSTPSNSRSTSPLLSPRHVSPLKQMDPKLINWTVLLLSKITKANNDPPHVGSTCRACNMSPIRGTRYRCVNCPDYDICESCENDVERQHDIGHVFVKIPKPLPLAPAASRSTPPTKEPLLPTLLYNDARSWNKTSGAMGPTTVHENVACSHCNTPSIIGVRYKCCQCENYNLCELCEPKVNHLPMHLFLKIHHPLPATTSSRALVPLVLHKGFYSYPSNYLRFSTHLNSSQRISSNSSGGSGSLATTSSNNSISSSNASGSGNGSLPLAGSIAPAPFDSSLVSLHPTSASLLPSPRSNQANSVNQGGNRTQDRGRLIGSNAFGSSASSTKPSNEISVNRKVPTDSKFEIKVHTTSTNLDSQNPTPTSRGSKEDSKLPSSNTSVKMRAASSTTHMPSMYAKPAGLQHTKTENMLLSIIRQEEEDEYQQWLHRQSVLARQRTHLRASFKLLMLAANMQPAVIIELYFLASRIILELAKQLSPEDVTEDVLQDASLGRFLSRVSELDPLIQSETMHLFEALCVPETYLGQGLTEVAIALRTARFTLRSKVVQLIESRLPKSLASGRLTPSQALSYAEYNLFLHSMLLTTLSAPEINRASQTGKFAYESSLHTPTRRAASPHRTPAAHSPGSAAESSHQGPWGEIHEESPSSGSLAQQRKKNWNKLLDEASDAPQQAQRPNQKAGADSPSKLFVSELPGNQLGIPFLQILQVLPLNSTTTARLWSSMLKPLRFMLPDFLARSPYFIALLKIALYSDQEFSKIVESDLLALLQATTTTDAFAALVPSIIEVVFEMLPRLSKSTLLSSCIQLVEHHVPLEARISWNMQPPQLLPYLLTAISGCLDAAYPDLQLSLSCLNLAVVIIEHHCDSQTKGIIISALSDHPCSVHSSETIVSRFFRIISSREPGSVSAIGNKNDMNSKAGRNVIWNSIHQVIISLFLKLAHGEDDHVLKIASMAFNEAKTSTHQANLIPMLVTPLLRSDSVIIRFLETDNICDQLIGDIISSSEVKPRNLVPQKVNPIRRITEHVHIPQSLIQAIALEDTQFVGRRTMSSDQGKHAFGSQSTFNQSQQSARISQIEGLDNLGSLCRIFHPSDVSLGNLLLSGGSGTVTSQNYANKEQPIIWTVEAKSDYVSGSDMENSSTTIPISPVTSSAYAPSTMPRNMSNPSLTTPTVSIMVEIMPPAIVRQIRLQFVQDHGLSTCALPQDVSIEHGITIASMLPSLICAPKVSHSSASSTSSAVRKEPKSLVTPTKAELMTSLQDGELWKLEMENLEVVRFLKIQIVLPPGPNGSALMALSKLQILGYVSSPISTLQLPSTLLKSSTTSSNSVTENLPVSILAKYLPSPPIHPLPLQHRRPLHRLLSRLPLTAAVSLMLHITNESPLGGKAISNNPSVLLLIDALLLIPPHAEVDTHCLDAIINTIVEQSPRLGEYVMKRAMDPFTIARHPSLFPRLLAPHNRSDELIPYIRARIRIGIELLQHHLKQTLFGLPLPNLTHREAKQSHSRLVPYIEVLGTALSRLPSNLLKLDTSVESSSGSSSSSSSTDENNDIEISVSFVNWMLRAACTPAHVGNLLSDRATSLLCVLTRANSAFFSHVIHLLFSADDAADTWMFYGPTMWRVLAGLALSSAECGKLLVTSKVIDHCIAPLKNHLTKPDSNNDAKHLLHQLDVKHTTQMWVQRYSPKIAFLTMATRSRTISELAGVKIIDWTFPFLYQRPKAPVMFEVAIELINRICSSYPAHLEHVAALFGSAFFPGPSGDSLAERLEKREISEKQQREAGAKASQAPHHPSVKSPTSSDASSPSLTLGGENPSSSFNLAIHALQHLAGAEGKIYWHVSPKIENSPLWNATHPDGIQANLTTRCKPSVESLALARLGHYDQYEQVSVNVSNSNTTLKISEDGRSVTATGTHHMQRWRTAICSNVLRHGVYYWEVTITKMSAGNVIIGVCEASHDIGSWIGQNNSARGWAYHGAGTTKGYTYHSGSFNSSYGKIMSEGDVIGVTLDLIEGTLSFSQNGVSLGVAYSNLTRQEVHPAVSLIDPSDSVHFSSPIYVLKSSGIGYGAQHVATLLSPFNPARLVRFEHSVFQSSPLVTLSDIKNTLINSLPPKSYENMELEIELVDKHGKPMPEFDDSTTLVALRDLYFDQIDDIIDIKFSLKPSTSQSDNGTIPLASLTSTSTDDVQQILQPEKTRPEPVIVETPLPANHSLLTAFNAVGTAYQLIDLLLERLISLQHLNDRALVLPSANGYEPLQNVPDQRLLSPTYRDVVLLVSAGKDALPAFHAHFKPKPVPSSTSDSPVNPTSSIDLSKNNAGEKPVATSTQPGETTASNGGTSTGSTTDSTSSSSKPSSQSNTKTGSKVPPVVVVPLGAWIQWLLLLRSLVSVEGFITSVSKDPTSISIFNEIIKDCVITAAPIQRARDLNGFESDWKTTLPRSLWSSPVQALFNCLVRHLTAEGSNLDSGSTEAMERAISMRNHMATNGALVSILVALSNAADVPHLKPTGQYFKTANEELIARKKLADQKASSTPKSSEPTGTQSNAQSAKSHWAKGTGYGTSDEDLNTQNGSSATGATSASSSASNSATVLSLHTLLIAYLKINPQTMDSEDQLVTTMQPSLCQEAYDILIASCLGPSLLHYLKNDSLLDMGKYVKYYEAVFELSSLVLQHTALLPLMMTPITTNPSSSASTTLRGSITALHDVISAAHKKLGFRRFKEAAQVATPSRASSSPLRNSLAAAGTAKIVAPVSRNLRFSAPQSPSPVPTVSVPAHLLATPSNTLQPTPTSSPGRARATSPQTRIASPSLQPADEGNALDEQTRMMNWILYLEQLVSEKLTSQTPISSATQNGSSSASHPSPSHHNSNGNTSSGQSDDHTEKGGDKNVSEFEGSLEPSRNPDVSDEFEEYKAALESLQFDEMEMQEDGTYLHHFKDKISTELTVNALKMRWLTHEIGTLSMGLPLHLSSSVFLRIDSSRIDVMKAVITGPKDTPYEDGIFIFDVYCPADYPKVPPLVNLQTTGSGSVRFNPNLYNCGKVCLSLLGTWRGGPNEMWQENESTLLQVFVSIQSLIFVDEPYFNEPGFENMMGTDTGRLDSALYNENIRIGTLKWAILEHLLNPPPGFEQVAKEHFTIKRVSIMKTCLKWLEEAKLSTTNGYLDRLQKLVNEIETQLQIIKPFTIESQSSRDLQANPDQLDPSLDPRWKAAIGLADLFPQFPIGLLHKALEICGDQQNTAMDWLFENGERYAEEHPEVVNESPPTPK